MNNKGKPYLLVLPFVLVLSGCVVRTYPVTKDRVDQNLDTGNLGYLMGQRPASLQPQERKRTRTTQAIEIELHSPIKFEKMPKSKSIEKMPVEKVAMRREQKEDQELWGNRGFITQGYSPKVIKQERRTAKSNIERYTVQKGDTLQKISNKFYGTTKKWTKIYEANKAILKAPNRIYPGQVIDIPTESLKETRENLK